MPRPTIFHTPVPEEDNRPNDLKEKCRQAQVLLVKMEKVLADLEYVLSTVTVGYRSADSDLSGNQELHLQRMAPRSKENSGGLPTNDRP